MRLALIDDFLGAPPERAPDDGATQAQFRDAAGKADAVLLFSDAWDDFLEDYTADAAIDQFNAWGEKPDVLLVDMMFGDKSALGLEILALIKDHPLVPARRAIFSTRSPEEEVFFNRRNGTFGSFAETFGARYILKDEALRPGELISRLEEIFA